jgi:imidazolonepropionase-like amidohydrolase
VKLADSRSGDVQTLAQEEIAAVVQEAHRRNVRVAIHSRGAGSTRAAALAGADWIVHADLATEADLDAVAAAGIPILPTLTFLATVLEAGDRYGQDVIQLDVSRMKRHFDLLIRVVERARALGIRILCGTDTGNNFFTPFGELHARELELLVNYCGFTPLEAITAATRDNAFAVGLEGQVGVLEAGRLADVIVLERDPLADVRVLQRGEHLAHVIKDGKLVRLDAESAEERPLAFQMALA